MKKKEAACGLDFARKKNEWSRNNGHHATWGLVFVVLII